MKKRNFLKHKNILVVGMGKSGGAVLKAAVDHGARVSIQDAKGREDMDPDLLEMLDQSGIRSYFGRVPDDMSEFDMLILSPGVPLDLPFIEEARSAGVEIIGELELAYGIARGNFVGITGTNGKTTTTTLVGEIFKKAGRRTSVVGNIGVPVISAAEVSSDDSWLVTEVSSFQLESVAQFRPRVSAILNLTPDHMDRHKTMENYGHAKARIFMNQTPDQYCVINHDDKITMALSKDCPARVVPFSRKEILGFGAFVEEGVLVVRDDEKKTYLCEAKELQIPGTHNLENALAAAAIAYFAGVDYEVIADTLKTFKGVEHRIEPCGEMDGVRFYNDSKGTNPDAAIKALTALEKKIILIAGGYDKKADFSEFVSNFRGRVKHAMLMGETADNIARTAHEQGFDDTTICRDMAECVEKAWQLAESGDVILLSPACASWDMYRSFEKRGEDFKECVQRLQR